MKINIKGVIISSDVKWIYDWFGIEATCPRDVSDALDKSAGQPVDVEINSGGGDIFAGSEIYTALRAYKGGVKIYVVGLAASAASVIAMAGYCEMSPTAMMMVHNVSTYAEGDYREMDHKSDVLQRANKTIASAYVSKSGMSEKDALKMMDAESWLTAQQAVEKKLVNKVMFSDTGQMVAAYGCQMLPPEVIEKMRNSLPKPQDQQNDQAAFLQAQLNIMKAKVILQ